MAFTYDPTTNRGKVRLRIGDTNTSDATLQIFTDAEIDAFLTMKSSNVAAAAASACRAIAADSARSAVAWSIPFAASMNKQQVPKYYMDLADKFDIEAMSDAAEYVQNVDDRIDRFGNDQTEYFGDIW